MSKLLHETSPQKGLTFSKVSPLHKAQKMLEYVIWPLLQKSNISGIKLIDLYYFYILFVVAEFSHQNIFTSSFLLANPCGMYVRYYNPHIWTWYLFGRHSLRGNCWSCTHDPKCIKRELTNISISTYYYKYFIIWSYVLSCNVLLTLEVNFLHCQVLRNMESLFWIFAFALSKQQSPYIVQSSSHLHVFVVVVLSLGLFVIFAGKFPLQTQENIKFISMN